jgi:hypothetical protein
MLFRGAQQLGLCRVRALCGRVGPAVRLLRPFGDVGSRAGSSGSPPLRSVLVRASPAAAEPAARAATFGELGLGDGLQAGLAGANITQPTEIQVKTPRAPAQRGACRKVSTGRSEAPPLSPLAAARQHAPPLAPAAPLAASRRRPCPCRPSWQAGTISSPPIPVLARRSPIFCPWCAHGPRAACARARAWAAARIAMVHSARMALR